MQFDKPGLIQATCDNGLAPWLAQELVALGYEIRREHRTGVELTGTLEDCQRLNLTSRLAYNILYQLAEFPCPDLNALYQEVKRLPWETMIPVEEHLAVVSKISTDCISDSRLPNLKVKDAIVDRIKQRTGARPNSGKERDGVVVHLNWHQERAWIYLNTSGTKLSDRGYRKMPHHAPLRETLAAGLLRAAGYDGTQALINPMCGSGTIAIEAALQARGAAAGLLRDNYGFKHLQDFDPAYYAAARDALKSQRRKGPYPKILATDIDPEAIAAAQQNARTAGVEEMISFAVCDFASTEIPTASNDGNGAGGIPGIVMLNPEYGMRLGEAQALEAVYKRIGDWFKQRCAGWTGYVFTGNLDLAKKVGLKASRRFEFRNGAIDCRLLRYELYASLNPPATQDSGS